jgi:hypothetical protein
MTDNIGRLALRQCAVTTLGEGQYLIDVLLKLRETEYKNQQEWHTKTELHLLAAVAQTTLDTICSALTRSLVFKVCDIQIRELGDPTQEFITALVMVDFGDKQMALPGICAVDDKKFEASAKAVLNAINRVVELYLKTT